MLDDLSDFSYFIDNSKVCSMQISILSNCLFDIFYAFDQHFIPVFPQCEKPISKMRKPTKKTNA